MKTFAFSLVTLLAMFFYQPLIASDSYIDTIAGGGEGDGFAATLALLDKPYYISIGSGGVFYITEASSKNFKHSVRRVDSAGIIQKFAGKGAPGFSGDGGPAIDALLQYPAGVAEDDFGNVYIADQSNHRIRKVSPEGIITTVAGTGQRGFQDGPALSAKFYYPEDLAVDQNNNVIIADTYNGKVRRLDIATDIVSTVVDGLSMPFDVYVDETGNIYVTDVGHDQVYKIDTMGQKTVFAGTGTAGYNGDNKLAVQAQLNNPFGITGDTNGDIFIADRQNHRIRMVHNGVITTVVGTGIAGYGGDGERADTTKLNAPSDVDVLPSGDCVVADMENNRIRKISPCTKAGTVTTIAGRPADFTGEGYPAKVASFSFITGAARDSLGNTYVVDNAKHRVWRIDTQGILESFAGTGSPGFGGDGTLASGALLRYPWDVAVDGENNVYILDTGNKRIRKVDAATGIISTFFDGNGILSSPQELAIDGSRNLYVADPSGQRAIYRIHNDGSYDEIGYGVFKGPSGVAADRLGNIFVLDKDPAKIFMITLDGAIDHIAGTGCRTGSIDGSGGDPCDNFCDGCSPLSTSFFNPESIAVNEDGSVIAIADTGNRRVRVIQNGVIITIGGNGLVTWSIDGEGGNPSDDLGDGGSPALATFSAPIDVYLSDLDGSLLVSDSTSTKPTRLREVYNFLEPLTTSVAISGHIYYYSPATGGPDLAKPVSGVTVTLDGPTPQTTITNAQGEYSFQVETGRNWQITPSKIGSAGTAVSSLDAAYILQKVVDKRQFNAIQKLTCDVTCNGEISSLDASKILQYIVGKISSFPVAIQCGSDFVFAPNPVATPNQQVTQPQLSLGSCTMGNINYTSLSSSASGQDFIVGAFGDCTGNWLI